MKGQKNIIFTNETETYKQSCKYVVENNNLDPTYKKKTNWVLIYFYEKIVANTNAFSSMNFNCVSKNGYEL